jgi:hypothetical protein
MAPGFRRGRSRTNPSVESQVVPCILHRPSLPLESMSLDSVMVSSSFLVQRKGSIGRGRWEAKGRSWPSRCLTFAEKADCRSY